MLSFYISIFLFLFFFSFYYNKLTFFNYTLFNILFIKANLNYNNCNLVKSII